MVDIAKNNVARQKSSADELHERIDSIIAMIPDDFDGKEDVVNQLVGRQGSIPYTAPEFIGMRWREVGVILSNQLPNPDSEGWAKDIATLFRKKLE